MSIRHPLRLWVIATALLACLAVGRLASRLRHPADPGPQTLGELCQRLQRSDPSLHIVLNADSGEEAGIYVCDTPQPRQRLHRLLRLTEWGPRWKGVVFCAREGSAARIPNQTLRSWGEYGMQLGELQLFGDPALLERIRKATFEDESGRPGPAHGSMGPSPTINLMR